MIGVCELMDTILLHPAWPGSVIGEIGSSEGTGTGSGSFSEVHNGEGHDDRDDGRSLMIGYVEAAIAHRRGS